MPEIIQHFRYSEQNKPPFKMCAHRLASYLLLCCFTIVVGSYNQREHEGIRSQSAERCCVNTEKLALRVPNAALQHHSVLRNEYRN